MDSVKSFKLDVKRAHYFQGGQAHPMTIPHLMFREDGDVHMEGSDSVGDFRITGELNNGYLYLTKEYIGKHKVYYLGKLEGHLIVLAYDFSENWENLKSKLDSNEIMAEIEFETTKYKLYFKEEGTQLDLFLAGRGDEKPGSFKGVAFKDGKLVRVKAKVKCHVKLNAKDCQEEFKGKYDPYNHIYVIKPEK